MEFYYLLSLYEYFSLFIVIQLLFCKEIFISYFISLSIVLIRTNASYIKINFMFVLLVSIKLWLIPLKIISSIDINVNLIWYTYHILLTITVYCLSL